MYRPFCKQVLYFDHLLNQRRYQQHKIFPTPATESENVVMCVAGVGDRKGFGCLVTNTIPSLDLAFEKTQCFPFYTYDEDGTNRQENITDQALAQFVARYGDNVSKWDIFWYTYALLHHPTYRERYAENLRRDLPRIPLLGDTATLHTLAALGKQLGDLHLHYEQQPEYPLESQENPNVPWIVRVERMSLTSDKSAVIVNESLTLAGIPPACFAYRLGNRSALEWVIDQYRVKEDTRSGIISDPNRNDDPTYLVRLVKQVVYVSVETMALVAQVAAVEIKPN
jgi:predicted helicase